VLDRLRTGDSFVSVWSSPLASHGLESDDVVMVDAEAEGTERRVRRWRSVAEKRRIVELTLEPGASVALVAGPRGKREPGICLASCFQEWRVSRADCSSYSFASGYGLGSKRGGDS